MKAGKLRISIFDHALLRKASCFYRFPSREHVRDIQVLIPKRGRTHLMSENSMNVKRMNEITDFILSLLLLSI